MSHYYTTDETVTSKKRNIEYTYKKKKYQFISDNGVFSKNRIDFGTNLLINSIDVDVNNKKILDVGCGIGIIGILLSTKNNYVEMIDINERAIALSLENIQINKVKAQAYVSNLYENVNSLFDMIISNPPIRAGKKIVHQIVVEGKEKLNPNGSIFIVIQKKQGAESMAKKMEEVYGNLTVVDKKNGYYILKSIKNL